MSTETFLNGKVTLHAGDSRDVLKTLPDACIDSIVTDPPYALVSIVKRFGKTSQADDTDTSDRTRRGADGYARLAKGFMGKEWDTGESAFASSFWAECLRVLKPGGHLVASSGTRTVHRMVCAIEDAGFEIRDSLQWLYGSGFPKSHDVSKGIDKAAGAEREVVGQVKRTGKEHGTYGAMAGDNVITAPATDAAREWEGWGTALKPAVEPICLARKPLDRNNTVAANVLQHGTGAINIDECRVGPPTDTRRAKGSGDGAFPHSDDAWRPHLEIGGQSDRGRWPANIIHDGSDEVLAAFPEVHGAGAARQDPGGSDFKSDNGWGGIGAGSKGFRIGDEGSAARFFYTAKADADDRLGSKHPTVKPVDLLQWLCRLVTPKGGTVLDPFAGTGTTGEAAFREGFNAVLIERETEYQADIRRRMALCMAGPEERKRESIKEKTKDQPLDAGPLFDAIRSS